MPGWTSQVRKDSRICWRLMPRPNLNGTRGIISRRTGVVLLVLGVFVATVGFALGFDSELFRTIAAVLLLAVGFMLVVSALQTRLSVAAAPIATGWSIVSAGPRRKA
jgi:hypothetical protein